MLGYQVEGSPNIRCRHPFGIKNPGCGFFVAKSYLGFHSTLDCVYVRWIVITRKDPKLEAFKAKNRWHVDTIPIAWVFVN